MVQTSQVKRTLEAKRNAGVAVLAMKLAKDKSDADWRKANKYKKLFVAAKQAVLRKFKGRALQEWQKQQAKGSSAKGQSSSKPKSQK